MDSGSVVPAVPVDHPKPQSIFDTVVEAGGCSSANSKLDCLRSLDYDTFLHAANSVPAILTYNSLNLSYLPRPDPKDNFFSLSPELAIANGNFAKVPIIIGDQEDEGTLFSLMQSNITNTDELVSYLKSWFPLATEEDVAGLVATYPDDPTMGSPYGTGELYNIYPEFKRLAAIIGDATFTLTRRVYLSYVASQVNSWSYLSTWLSGLPVLGTFHGTDILEAYFDLPDEHPEQAILNYYVSFINTQDPNSYYTIYNLAEWPQWTTANPTLLDFGGMMNSVIPDNFRQESADYLAKAVTVFRV